MIFFGPIILTKFRTKIKRWDCIFFCFSTRAVHLEVCYIMTCDSFFHFFSTCGHATRFIWCDNSTNLKTGSKFLTHSFKTVKWKGVVNKWSAQWNIMALYPALCPFEGWKLGKDGRARKKFNRCNCSWKLLLVHYYRGAEYIFQGCGGNSKLETINLGVKQ